jgi:hypothetical protein
LFPKLLGNFDLLNISKWFWKFFQEVLETFHALQMLLGQCTPYAYPAPHVTAVLEKNGGDTE